MAPSRFFHAQLFKLSLLFALMLILFLLYSSFFLSADFPKAANFLQAVNLIISSPFLLWENITGRDPGWMQTAAIIFCFWFTFIYTGLIVLRNFLDGREGDSSQTRRAGE